jgi:hypothetical protein
MASQLLHAAKRSIHLRGSVITTAPSLSSLASSSSSKSSKRCRQWLRSQQPQRANSAALSSSSSSSASSSILHPTSPLYASPNKYVTGVTTNQLVESQAVKDWYAANFTDWENEPDKIIVGEEDVSSPTTEVNDDESEEEYIDPVYILPESLASRNIRPLVAYLRTPGVEEGSRNCVRMRNPSVNDDYLPLIPGMLHGSDPTNNILSIDSTSKIMVKTPWFEIQRELDRYHYGNNGSFTNRVYALTVFASEDAHLDHHRSRQVKKRDRNKYTVNDETNTIVPILPPKLPIPPSRIPIVSNVLVIPSDLQMHPVGHYAYCVNYIRYHPNKPIKIKIQCINEEESPAMKRGGFLSMVNRSVECLVQENVPIPQYIQLECTGLRQKDVVRRNRLLLPDGVSIHPRVAEDYLIGTVFGAKGGSAADDEKTEEDEKKK